MKKYLLFFLLTHLSGAAFSQYKNYDPNALPNDYQSENNPFYWKNRKPSASYWQQDVYYQIRAGINEKTGIIDGEETLTYWNNSPDTLSYVYFHLYQQAFIKGGYVENLNLNNNFKQTFGKYESQGLGEIVESFKSENIELKREDDFSVVKVYLNKNLLPGHRITFQVKFKTYFDDGTQRRRMKKFAAGGFTHYDGVHWYPRICVYDQKFGWDTDQHLGKEFYGDFGTYDVELTFASNYVVGATGTLQNSDDVLPAELRQQLDISNFSKKPWDSPPSVIVPYDSSKRKTWHFYAENVHDFAWTADPTYRISEAYATIYDPYLKGNRKVLCQALMQEPHASGWYDAAQFTARTIEVYSRDFGAYSWPQIIVADARDGMEYPMLTLDGGRSSGYYDLLAHEIGHMWFFAQVGNNETYRAALDEGFAQFIESWAMKQIFGDTIPQPQYRNRYYNKFKEPNLVVDRQVYVGYLSDAIKGTDESINQHSDAFNGALGHGGGYRHVYYKMGTMLWNLQYVMGDSLFQHSMKHYFDQWKLCHPYFEDFRNSIIEYSHVDLNWFFDEWMETTKTIDYAVKNVRKPGKSEGIVSYIPLVSLEESNAVYQITFSRKGRSQMPIDFDVEALDGKIYHFYIPNTWFQKKNPSQINTIILPKWYGWDKINPDYTCEVFIPSGIRQITIDPSNRLADVYMPDNIWESEIEWHFDSQVSNPPDWKKYEVNWRPDLWYNAVDGIKAGFHLDGDYFDIKNKFSLTAWFNSTLLQNGIFDYSLENPGFDSISPVSFNLVYSSNTHRFIKNSSVDLAFKYLDGMLGGAANFSIQVNSRNSVSMGLKSMRRPSSFDLQYLLYPNWWVADKWNNTTSLAYDYIFQYRKGSGDIHFALRSSALASDYNYADLTGTMITRNRLGKFDFNTRLTGRIGTGSPAPESELYLAGASPEEFMDNKFVRSKGFVPQDWLGDGLETGHFQHGGGLNLRGYAGYLSPELNEKDSITYYVYSGKTGAAINGELDFDKFIRLRPKFTRDWLHIDSYFFADAGTMAYKNSGNDFFLSEIRADAGLGLAMTIKDWGPLEKVKPLTVRIDFPFLINRAPAMDSNYLGFRWMMSVGRAF